jgi:hypothetical protein
VTFHGRLPRQQTSLWRSYFQSGDAFLSADRVPGAKCGIAGSGITDFEAKTSGHRVKGHFVISGGRQGCHQGEGSECFLPGSYIVGLGCTACQVSVFHITAGSLPFTGRALTPQAVTALGLLMSGAVLVRLGRRRRSGV